MHVFIELTDKGFSPTTIGWHIYPDGSWVELVVRKGYAEALFRLYRRLGLDAAYQCVDKPPALNDTKKTGASRQEKTRNEAHY